MKFRITVILRAVLGIVRGNIIVIEDHDSNCRAYVGSRISKTRFKSLLNNLAKPNLPINPI